MTQQERIEQLRELDVEDGVTQLQGEGIALLFDTFEQFRELDEQPGSYDGDYPSGNWHWKLRQARNGCAAFFDIINAKDGDPARVLARLRQECEYHPLDEGSVDGLIAYKDALEDRYAAILGDDLRNRLLDKVQAWDVMDSALSDTHNSAADVCAVGYEQQEWLKGRRR